MSQQTIDAPELLLDEPASPPLYWLWIDANCGWEAQPDWEIDWPIGRPLEACQIDAMDAQARGFPTVITLVGATPRPDGLYSNPATNPT